MLFILFALVLVLAPSVSAQGEIPGDLDIVDAEWELKEVAPGLCIWEVTLPPGKHPGYGVLAEAPSRTPSLRAVVGPVDTIFRTWPFPCPPGLPVGSRKSFPHGFSDLDTAFSLLILGGATLIVIGGTIFIRFRRRRQLVSATA